MAASPPLAWCCAEAPEKVRTALWECLGGHPTIWFQSHLESSRVIWRSSGGHLESSRVIWRSSGVIQSHLEVIRSHPKSSVGHLRSCRVIQGHPESSVGHLESSRVFWKSSGVIQSHLVDTLGVPSVVEPLPVKLPASPSSVSNVSINEIATESKLARVCLDSLECCGSEDPLKFYDDVAGVSSSITEMLHTSAHDPLGMCGWSWCPIILWTASKSSRMV